MYFHLLTILLEDIWVVDRGRGESLGVKVTSGSLPGSPRVHLSWVERVLYYLEYHILRKFPVSLNFLLF